MVPLMPLVWHPPLPDAGCSNAFDAAGLVLNVS